MNRILVVPLVVIALAALALADQPSSAPVKEARIRQLERNQDLLEKLVQGGVDLAKAEDRLKRVRCCNEMLKSLADEIKQAAKEHDSDRALELGKHLHDLLERGVAGNLTRESRQIPGGSARMEDLRLVRAKATKIIAPLEEELQKTASGDADDMKDALEVVQKGQAALAGAILVKSHK
jgi:hypothetical protein